MFSQILRNAIVAEVLIGACAPATISLRPDNLPVQTEVRDSILATLCDDEMHIRNAKAYLQGYLVDGEKGEVESLEACETEPWISKLPQHLLVAGAFPSPLHPRAIRATVRKEGRQEEILIFTDQECRTFTACFIGTGCMKYLAP